MPIEASEQIHRESGTEKTLKASQYTREQFLTLYRYFIAHRERLSALPKEIANIEKKTLPIARRTKLTAQEKEWKKKYEKLKSEQNTLLRLVEVLEMPEYRSFKLEFMQQPAATVLVAESREQKGDTEKGEARVPVRSEKRETTTTRVTDVWHKIIQQISWPARMDHALREQIERRYAAQEQKLAEAVSKKRNKAEAIALFDELARGLRAIVAGQTDVAKEVVEDILRGVKTHVDILPDVSDVGKVLAAMKKSDVYRDLFKRFQTLLNPKDCDRAERFIREIMYPRLTMVYNGSVPEEVYDRLIAELEVEVQKVRDAYAHTLAQFKIGLQKRRRGEPGAA